MTNETSVQVLCDENDPNLDVIASRMAILQHAVRDNMLVAISCKDDEQGEPVILLAVISKDGGGDYLQYSPIAELYFPENASFERLTPPSKAITVEGASNVEH